MNAAIIVAGGTGQRLAAEIPKQFLKINDREILSFSVQQFNSHADINHVILVCHSDWIDHCRSNYKNCIIATGGQTRQDSVRAGLQACPEGTVNVLIHDAARPFLPVQVITDCINALQNHDAVAPVLPPVNSLIRIVNDTPEFVDRNQIRAIQTPQCFDIKIISKILQSDFNGSDEIGVALRVNPSLSYQFTEGAVENFKITNILDMKLAEQIAESWNK